MAIETVQTRDGSWTCFNTELGEHYHNLSGAMAEARSIYRDGSRLARRLATQSHLSVLDPFFGLGYNSFALMETFRQLRASEFPDATLTLIALELDPEILVKIPAVMENRDLSAMETFWTRFEHNTYYQTQPDRPGWDRLLSPEAPLVANFGIEASLLVADVRQLVHEILAESFDIILHDAFSSKTQPELWTTQLFMAYRRLLKPDTGTVLTYSAASAVRVAMASAGLHLYGLPNPGSKTGTAGFIKPQPEGDWPELTPLARALMACRSGVPFEDSDLLDRDKAAIIENRAARYAESTLPSAGSCHKIHGHHWD